MKGPTDPAWLAATYRLQLPLARALVRDHGMRQWRRFLPLSVVAAGLWLAGAAAELEIIATPRLLRDVFWPAGLLLLGLHLWLAQRSARVAIVSEAKRLARQHIADDQG